MMVDPLISIIMPAYNAEKTIAGSIDSVLGQSYSSWELLVIDDGSTDSTAAIVKKAASMDARVTLVQNSRNLGVSASRNRGVARASGGWVAFLDSDDQWRPSKLEKQVAAIREKGDVGLVYTGSSFLNSAGQESSYTLKVPESVSYHGLLKQNIIPCSSVLAKKELLQKYPMGRDDMHEDYAVWLQILKGGHCAYGVNEPLLLYRLSENSKSANKRKAAAMTYKVYQFLGLGRLQSLYYFSCYAWRNMKKYFYINRGI